jgi:hypothetical protein
MGLTSTQVRGKIEVPRTNSWEKPWENDLNYFPRQLRDQNTGSEIEFQNNWSGERGSNPRPQLWELSDSSPRECTAIHRSGHFTLKAPGLSTLVNADPWENRGNVGNSVGPSKSGKSLS